MKNVRNGCVKVSSVSKVSFFRLLRAKLHKNSFFNFPLGKSADEAEQNVNKKSNKVLRGFELSPLGPVNLATRTSRTSTDSKSEHQLARALPWQKQNLAYRLHESGSYHLQLLTYRDGCEGQASFFLTTLPLSLSLSQLSYSVSLPLLKTRTKVK